LTRVRASLLVLLGVVSILAAHAPVCRPDLIHIDKLNDQIGYITTARWLADTGELRSQLVYPASFGDRWRIYMPGHYWALATSYLVLGDLPLTWLLPSLLGFAVATLCVFLTGCRLYDTRSGAVAAALFAAFPANIFLAFTSMSEQTFIAAALLSFCVFVHLKRPLHWMPLLLVLPFLFREAGAFLLLPMLAVALSRGAKARPVAVSTLASLAVLVLVFAWQAGDGRQGLPISWLLADFNYLDVTIEEPALDWHLVTIFAAKAVANVEMLTTRLFLELTDSWEPTISALQLLLLGLTLGWGYRRAPNDLFPLGAGLLGICVLLLVMVMHSPKSNILYRHMLITVPFGLVAIAPLLLALWTRVAGTSAARSRWRTSVPALCAALVLLMSHLSVRAIASDFVALEAPPETQRLEQIGHDDRTMLVSSFRLLDYVRKHYPVQWSFVPANEATLRQLAEHYEIGTILVHRGGSLRPSFLAELGLVPVAEFDRVLTVFQRPEESAGRAEARR
jgi:hypothetical protein